MKKGKKALSVALALTMAVGVSASCGGGNKEADNTPPTLRYLYNSGSGHKAIGEYLQSAVSTAGLNMTLENQEWATFLTTRKNGDYMIARNGWLADYSDPICFLDMWVSNSGNNDVQFGKGEHKDLKMYNLDLTAYGGTKIENGTWAETYDVLIGKIKAESNETKRYEMMHMAEDMLMDTGCITPLYYYTDLYMLSNKVHGFYSNPLGYKYFQETTIDGGAQSITVCLASEPQSIDPALNSAVDGATMLAHLFSGIAKWEQDESGKLVVVADSATELPDGTVNDDGTVTYVYQLKENTWSNGESVKASDFEYSWKRAASAELGADYEYMFSAVKGYGEKDVDGLAPLAVEADDAANTLTVTLNNAISYWNELLAFPTFYPVHRATVASEAWATEPATYVSNGAYTLESWTHKSKITIKKRAEFFGADKVTMPEINFALSDDANAMLTNFKKGDWQLIDDVPSEEIATLKKDYPTEFFVAGQIGTYYICWNINAEVLPKGSELKGVEAEKARAEIRKAVALLIDRNHIVNEIAQGGQVPASSFVAMGMKNPDNTEFYQTANGGKTDTKKYFGYYDVSEDAYAANCNEALATLKKYYTLKTK